MIAAVALDRPMVRRSLFVGAHLFGFAALAWLIVLPVAGSFADREARIVEDGALLARYRAVSDQESAVDALAVQAQRAATGSPYLIGTSESAIEADLQARLKQVTEAAGARLRAVRTLPERTIDGNAYVGARVEITSQLSTMHRTLTEIETQAPFLFVTSAVLRPSGETPATLVRAADKEARAPGPAMPVEAILDIYGAWRKGGPGE